VIFSVTSSTVGGNPNTTSGVTTTQTPTAGAASNTATLTVAPLQSVFTNLIAGATLVSATGIVPNGPNAGAPYMTVPGAAALAPGGSVTISVKFTYTGTAPISYVSKTLSGAF
jgi:hypothetical protein